MTDFIPGDEYRIDIIGADDAILVDSWNSQIKANVVAQDGTIQVDTATGKLYGPLVGNIEDIDGNVIYDAVANSFNTTVSGNILDLNNNIIVNVADLVVNANLNGNVVDALGEVIVDKSLKTIDANTVTANTFYGDLVGSITADSLIYGTFSGDFNGTAYGDFFGDTTGNHFGDVTGNLTGDVTGHVFGNLHGQLLSNRHEDDGLPLNIYSDFYNQWMWVGGVDHPNPPEDGSFINGPIIEVGATRSESVIRANLVSYDRQMVLHLKNDATDDNDPFAANYFGRSCGEFAAYAHNSETPPHTILSYRDGKTKLDGYNGLLQLGIDNTNDIELNPKLVITNFDISDGDPLHLVRTFKGSNTNKATVINNDPLYLIETEAFTGNGFVNSSLMGFFVDGTVDSNANNVPTKFALSLADGVNQAGPNNQQNLEFDKRGVLTSPVFKAKGTTFAGRDSIAAEAGMIIFNSSNNKFQGYTGTAWVDLQ